MKRGCKLVLEFYCHICDRLKLPSSSFAKGLRRAYRFQQQVIQYNLE
ncbi:hypothetical protein H6G97_41125 [Nostoc flagelliforme FACHB-838]|uniref:Transposase n=1 Tax=Nostoc flagelliforme FACHB-838 TaxID=2692904 RepID=A0ABR8E2H8_9NOSO|nr:hypothetical protein [Nostoc flagelliforme FACHB-838]